MCCMVTITNTNIKFKRFGWRRVADETALTRWLLANPTKLVRSFAVANNVITIWFR